MQTNYQAFMKARSWRNQVISQASRCDKPKVEAAQLSRRNLTHAAPLLNLLQNVRGGFCRLCLTK